MGHCNVCFTLLFLLLLSSVKKKLLLLSVTVQSLNPTWLKLVSTNLESLKLNLDDKRVSKIENNWDFFLNGSH